MVYLRYTRMFLLCAVCLNMPHVEIPSLRCTLRQQLPTVYPQVCILFWCSRSINDAHTVKLCGGRTNHACKCHGESSKLCWSSVICTSNSATIVKNRKPRRFFLIVVLHHRTNPTTSSCEQCHKILLYLRKDRCLSNNSQNVGPDTSPLGHFQSSLDDLASISHDLKTSGILFLPSFHSVRKYSLCFPVPSV